MQIQISIKECSMCGDLGIEEELFQCERCLYRLQHRYCSKLYVDGELNELICDWCLHEQESSNRKGRSTRKIRSVQYISTEEPTDVKPSPDNVKSKGGNSTHNVESVNGPTSAAVSNNNEYAPQHSMQSKEMVGGKEKIVKQRYRYKSLSKIV